MRHTRSEAVKQLDAALVEQDRLGERFRAALGTSSEFAAYARLRAASDEVVAQQVCLQSIDDERASGRAWINGRKVRGPGPLGLFRDSYD